MVHNIAARIQKFCFVEASYVSAQTSHNSFNSSINGCKYISMSFPGAVGPGIRSNNMKNVCFIHIQGGKVYGIRTTGHMLCEIDIFPKGLNPSLIRVHGGWSGINKIYKPNSSYFHSIATAV